MEYPLEYVQKREQEQEAADKWRERARALLERYASTLRESFREDGTLAGDGFNISLSDQVQLCREVRAFLYEERQF